MLQRQRRIGEEWFDSWLEELQKGNLDLEGISRLQISRRGFETQREPRRGAEMAVNILRDHDRLDVASSFVI